MPILDSINTPEQPDENPYRARVLHEAANLITGERQKDYGSPEENFKRIADFWSIHLRKQLKPGETISPRQVTEMMVLLKIARTIESPTEDSYKDAAGYAGIAAELAEQERTNKNTEQVISGPVIKL